MFYLLGISVVLAALLLVNGTASLTGWLVWMAFRRRISSWSAPTSARTLFLMRTIPAAVSLLFAVFLLTPAFLIYEPRSGHESVSVRLGLLAICGALGVLVALIRATASWRATTSLVKDWLNVAEPVQLPGVGVRAFSFEHRFPLIAVVGIIRPRLFIAKHVFESLTREELSAALQHALGHISARDNLKRALMRGCRDLLVLDPFTRNLDRAWLEATESAADDHATRVGGNTNLDLASALVKIARMVPAGMRPTVPAGAFLISDDGSHGFRSRVRRLLQRERTPKTGSVITQSRIVNWLATVMLIVAAGLVVGMPHVLLTTHHAIEHLVHFLR
jgi:Zn-dependent protease with chaperone function